MWQLWKLHIHMHTYITQWCIACTASELRGGNKGQIHWTVKIFEIHVSKCFHEIKSSIELNIAWVNTNAAKLKICG